MKGLSIITPHWNDPEGLEQLFHCWNHQTVSAWEWIIVDDCSDAPSRSFLDTLAERDKRIRVIYNKVKSNAGSCRNVGLLEAQFDNVVFVDSDDFPTTNFVANRLLEVREFQIFLNMGTFKNEIGDSGARFSDVKTDFLNSFLRTRFAWQTAAILWNKDFLIKIGQFDEKLILLEDVELSIRALEKGKEYNIINDNEIDFFYRTKSAGLNRRPVNIVCDSVCHLVHKSITSFHLSESQLKLLPSYYFLACRYVAKSTKIEDFIKTGRLLLFFNTHKLVPLWKVVIGLNNLMLRFLGILPGNLFLALNRRMFKA